MPRSAAEVRERLVFAGLVLACFVIVASVASLVGAMAYAGWLEPPNDAEHQAECCC